MAGSWQLVLPLLVWFHQAYFCHGYSIYTWKHDNVTTLVQNNSNSVILTLSASHLVLPAEHLNWGHFAIKIQNESTPCLDWHTSEEEILRAINALPSVANRGGVSVVSTVDGYGYSHSFSMMNRTHQNDTNWFLPSLSIERQSPTRTIELSTGSAYISNVQSGDEDMKPCDPVRTWGEWEDSTQWVEGVVPGSKLKLQSDVLSSSSSSSIAINISSVNDYVVIPKESGFIQLTSSIGIGGLQMNGGNIVTMSSGCPSGWSKPSHANNGNHNIDIERNGIHAGKNNEYNLNNLNQNKQFGFNDLQRKCFAAFYGPSKVSTSIKNGVGNNKFNNEIENENNDHIQFQKPSSNYWYRSGFQHNEKDLNIGATWKEAEDICRIVSPGSNGHLASIESYYENEIVKNLCQGLSYEKLENGPGDEVFRSSIETSDEGIIGTNKRNHKKSILNGQSRDLDGIDSELASKVLGDDGSVALSQSRDPRCWIGLRDENLDGESCAVMSSSLYSIERQHIGEWHDERCDSNFAFVCERSSISKGYNLIIGGLGMHWSGGVFSGGGIVRNLGAAYISSDMNERDGDATPSSTHGFYGDDDIMDVDNNDWRMGAAWLQGLNEVGLTDAVRMELYGVSVVEENTLISAGDGAVFAIIDEKLNGNDADGEFNMNLINIEEGNFVSAWWPSDAPWYINRDFHSTSSSSSSISQRVNALLNNDNSSTALYLKSNITFRSVKGNTGQWEPPSIPHIQNSGGKHNQNSYYNNDNELTSSNRNGASDAISSFADQTRYEANLNSNKVKSLWKKAMTLPASSHDTAMRGVAVTGSGKVTVTLPVTGSGRRPRLLNKAQVWFVGADGDSQVEWFYEAGASGRGGRSSNGTMYNATGILIANSSVAKLSMAGGGIATGGSSFSLQGGIELSNFSMVLSSSPTFILALSAESPVVREERNWGIIHDELLVHAEEKKEGYPDPTDATPASQERAYGANGTYRVAVRHPVSGEAWETKCLPYHSTAQHLEAALSELTSVVALGGATVTRDGDPTSPRWGYGYKYKIVFDVANEIKTFGMTAGDRSLFRSTSGGGGGDSSSVANNQAPWAWDLEAGVMADGRKLYNDEDESSFYASYRNTTNLASSMHTDVYISCQGSKLNCGCADLLTFLDNDDKELNQFKTNHNDVNREDQSFKANLNHKILNLNNNNLKSVPSSSSTKDKIIKEFGYHGKVCRYHHVTSKEDIYACEITPRITMVLLHGGGESFVHDGNLTSISSSLDDDDREVITTTSSYVNPNARQLGSSLMTISQGFHRLPSLLAGSSGIEVIGGTAYVIARNFTASFAYMGVNQTKFRRFDDNNGIDHEPFLSDAGVNGTGGLGKLGGGIGGQGLLICAGAGFAGLDNALLLYEGPERQERNNLIHSPFFGKIAGQLSIENGGELRLATMQHISSGFIANEVLLDSGSMLSGWATTTALKKLTIRGSYAKRLRTAASLVCGVSCKGLWAGSGAVWFSEGSNFINRGHFDISAYRLDRDIAEFVLSDDSENTSNPRGGYGPGNSYGGGSDGYGSGGKLGVETRNDVDFGYDASREGWVQTEQFNDMSGWYINPLCGKHCSRAPYLINTITGMMTVLESSNPRIGLFVRNLGEMIINKQSRLSCGGGGDGNGKWEFGYGSVMRVFGGKFIMEGSATRLYSQHSASVATTGVAGDVWGGINGTLEVSGGGPHQLADVFDGPRLSIYGGEVEVRSRFFDLRGGLSIYGGTLAFTVSSTRAFIDGDNFTMTGGLLRFVEILPHSAMHPNHIHNQVRNADRSFLTLTSKFLWSGGTLKGNAEIGAREEIKIGEELSPLSVATAWSSGLSAYANQNDVIGSISTSKAQELARQYGARSATSASLHDILPYFPQESMRLESLLHLISYKRTRWFKGDIITSNSAAFIEAGSVWMENPRAHTSRVLVEPLPGEHHNRNKLLTMWEDNEASIHQEFGGFA